MAKYAAHRFGQSLSENICNSAFRIEIEAAYFWLGIELALVDKLIFSIDAVDRNGLCGGASSVTAHKGCWIEREYRLGAKLRSNGRH